MKRNNKSQADSASHFAQPATSDSLLQEKIAKLEAENTHLRKVGRVREPKHGFGGTLQRLREQKNLSLTELAHLSGCSKPSVSRIERQDAPNIKLCNILKLAAGLGLKPSEVFAEYEKENAPHGISKKSNNHANQNQQ